MNLGLSISICFEKAGEYAKSVNLLEIYTGMLDFLTKVASENNLKIIEIASVPPFDSNFLGQIKDEIRKRLEKFETLYHLPSWEINICALNPEVRRVSVDETKKLIDLAKELGIKKVSMHPGCYAAMPDTYSMLGQQVRAVAEKTIPEIFGYCVKNDIELCIENLPVTEPFFQRPDEFEPFVEKGIGMLVDTAHAVTAGVDPIDFVRKFGKRISEVHLVDGFRGKQDIHYPIGTGEVNYRAFLDELKRIEYEGPVILELKSEKDVVDSIDVLRKSGFF